MYQTRQHSSFEEDKNKLKEITLNVSGYLVQSEDIRNDGHTILNIASNDDVAYEVRYYLNAIGNFMIQNRVHNNYLRHTVQAGLRWCVENYSMNIQENNGYV